MSIFGYSEPVVIGVLLFLVVVIVYGLPYLQRKKNVLDYSNYDFKHSNAYFHFAGSSGPGYENVKLSADPITHNNGHATIPLETLPNPLVDVILDENDSDCNVVIKRTTDAIFGKRIDILCNVDANSCKHAWNNIYVQNWGHYRDKFMDAARNEVVRNSLHNKELLDEMKDSASAPLANNNGAIL